jgi:hypothetical protein
MYTSPIQKATTQDSEENLQTSGRNELIAQTEHVILHIAHTEKCAANRTASDWAGCVGKRPI